ncbi:MAG: SBBP repeat-containing protein, partial [Pseudonocardiaceae bacterium]
MVLARQVTGVVTTPSSIQGGSWKVGLAAAALTGLLVGGCAAPKASLSSAGPATKSGLAERFDQLPLIFEANAGQTDSAVSMAARGRGYGLFLTPNETVLRLKPSRPAADPWILRMQLVGSNASPVIGGEEPFAGTVNYLKGTDPSTWRRDVPTYGKARYRDVYPGTDMVLYGSSGRLEYDFILAPGADPAAIAMRFDGADNLSLAANGDLVVTGGGGEVRQAAPHLYQGQGNQRATVEGRFELRPEGQVGFSVGPYDPSQPLIIDPVLDYSTYLGGGGIDYARDIAVSGNNAYVVGTTDSLDFPTRGQVQIDKPGNDVFVSKLSGDGSELVYSTYLGGGAEDQGLSIAVGDSSAYV